MKAFAELTQTHQRILELLYVEEKTPQEAAAILGCKVDNIYNQQYRAFRIIKRIRKEGIPILSARTTKWSLSIFMLTRASRERASTREKISSECWMMQDSERSTVSMLRAFSVLQETRLNVWSRWENSQNTAQAFISRMIGSTQDLWALKWSCISRVPLPKTIP